MPAEREDIVRTVRLCRTFRTGTSEVHAVSDLTMSVPRGAFVALRGRSGSGKTTLLNLIGALDRPTSGDVFLDGRNLWGLSERQRTEVRRLAVGFVFQSFALLPALSTRENVELPLRLARESAQARTRRASECLDMVGLANRQHHRPHELSGGQQQRAAIARALANRPELVLADEPTGELDSRTGRTVLALFRRIVDEQGVTVILATHDPVVDEYASVVHLLQDGRIQD
jgi:putative ABC transport system ATP-binding protein